ncbi:MAG TPA: gliding motility-associated ABC transporter ATP-binding subunit GldA [Bacteroidales bacterium]|nr:gliding motility-associated ABC transporter ATP-binding subunit GldA [Bacteroidales bacterium]HOE05066.1 gliding motility-associated ABC transporter ATP-binding subunit GldA [Bacteroidales bacterium]
MSIEVKNITKLFGKQKALDGVSFSIKSGEIAGFLGPNGAGKSTMMKILTGFIPPSSGDAYIHGVHVLDDSIAMKRLIGYLPENNPLYPDMYIREYLEFVAGIYQIKKDRKKRIAEVIEKTGLSPEINKKIGALSKGYKQRVGLAQAIIHDPQVLILDEPTSGLDPNQIIEIRNLIVELGKHKTVMLSTHILQEVQAICQKIIIINKGSIVADDQTGALQDLSENHHKAIHVVFEKAVLKKSLTELAGVAKVASISETEFVLQQGTNRDIRPEIMKFAVKNSLNILSMTEQSKSLEQVFQDLTK